MYEDPYLKKRREEEAEIQRQVDAKLKKKNDDFTAAYQPPEPYLGEFVPGPSGLFVPVEDPLPDGWGYKSPADYISTTAKPPTPNVFETLINGSWNAGYGKGPAADIKDVLAYAAEKIIGNSGQYESLLPYCNCPICRGQRDPEPDEHKILRGFHGRAYEYVWSETLKVHVRIGESLKVK